MRFEAENEKIYFNLAMLATDMKEYEDAATWFQRAIQVSEPLFIFSSHIYS